MLRTPIARTGTLKSARRTRKCAVKGCANRFQPLNMRHKVCGGPCATIFAAAERKRLDAKQTREAKAASRSRQDWLKLAERAVNRYVVLRDRHYGCISCDKGPHWDGVWHASHYKSVGSNSALRYNLWNIHKACSQCNFFQAGNIANYEVRLGQKIGSERLEWLKNHPRSREYSIEYLGRITEIFNKKFRRLKRRTGA